MAEGDKVERRAQQIRDQKNADILLLAIKSKMLKAAVDDFSSRLLAIRSSRTKHEIYIDHIERSDSELEVGFWFRRGELDRYTVLTTSAHFYAPTIPVHIFVTPADRHDAEKSSFTEDPDKTLPESAAKETSEIVVSAMGRMSAMGATLISPAEADVILQAAADEREAKQASAKKILDAEYSRARWWAGF